MSKKTIQMGFTVDEYCLLLDCLFKQFSSDDVRKLWSKLYGIGYDLGVIDEDTDRCDNSWRDGHPSDFGDR